MLITLSPQFSLLSDSEFKTYSHPIQNLITAHAQGWHIFVPSRELIDRIIGSIVLSDTQRVVLDHYIRGKYADLSGQAQSVGCRVVAIPRDSSMSSPEPGNLDVYLDRFSNLECCLASELLVENGTRDGVLLPALAKIMGGLGTSKLPLKFRTVHGGGSSVGDELIKDAHGCPPRLGIVDSDKIHPDGGYGATAKRALDAIKEIDDPLIRLEILPCRSIENFIPNDVYRIVFQEDHDVLKHFDILDNISSEESDRGVCASRSLLHFISLKKGVKFGDVRKSNGDFKISLSKYVIECGGDASLAADNDPSCDDEIVVNKRASKALEKVISFMIRDEQRFVRILEDKVEKIDPHREFRSVLDMIVSFGLAGRPILGASATDS